MESGLFFENYVHYNGIYPPLFYHLRQNRTEIEKLGLLLYEDIASFHEGTGRSGSDASRFARNLKHGLGKRAYFSGSGFDPAVEKDDLYVQISGSGGKPLNAPKKFLRGNSQVLRGHLDIAKSDGLVTCGITRDSSSYLAKKADIVIILPNYIAGEKDIKQYFDMNLSGDVMPFQELGAVFEVSGLELIDALCYSLTKYKGKGDFPFDTIEDKIRNSLVYMGELGYSLEDQKSTINRIIKKIRKSKGNVYTTGFRFSAEIAEIGAIRINHAIYENDKRESGSIDSNNYPIIKKGDILIPISAEGESEFTKMVVDDFYELGNPIFPLTSNIESSIALTAGDRNCIIFPKGNEYKLSKDYLISDFNQGSIRVIDSIALSLGRSEEEMRKSHSSFA